MEFPFKMHISHITPENDRKQHLSAPGLLITKSFQLKVVEIFILDTNNYEATSLASALIGVYVVASCKQLCFKYLQTK